MAACGPEPLRGRRGDRRESRECISAAAGSLRGNVRRSGGRRIVSHSAARALRRQEVRNDQAFVRTGRETGTH